MVALSLQYTVYLLYTRLPLYQTPSIPGSPLYCTWHVLPKQLMVPKQLTFL